MSNRYILLLGVAFMSGCGPAQNQVPTTPASQVTQKAEAPRDVEDDAWKSITNFAQSIEDVKLEFDVTKREATVNFNYRDLDSLDEKGIPYFSYVIPLKGRVGADSKARLVNKKAPRYAVELTCEDSDCLNASLAISNKNEGRLSGIAMVKKTTTSSAESITGHDGMGSYKSMRAQISNAVHRSQYRAELTTYEVVGGRKILFDARLNFSNATLLRQDSDYFDKKVAFVSGEAGSSIKGHLGIVTVVNDTTFGGNDLFQGDVIYVPERHLVSISVKDPGEGLTFLTVGRKLYPEKK